MEDCEACQEATERPRTCGSYSATCNSCTHRMLAHSPAAKDAMLGHPQELQAAMRQLSKTQEAYRQMRIGVYEWMRRMDEAKLQQM